ncbi:hypothetical protein C8R44DRAFT_822910, partial [Mycena epipterygia]
TQTGRPTWSPGPRRSTRGSTRFVTCLAGRDAGLDVSGGLTSAHENGERAGESNGHVSPSGMSHSPHPLIRHVDIKQRRYQKKVVAPALPRHGRHEGLDERRGMGVHAAHGADLAGECIGEGWVSFICGFSLSAIIFLSFTILCLFLWECRAPSWG